MYHKKESVGSFLRKGEDIKDGDMVIIANEGKQVEGNFGMQDLFLVKTKDGKEGNVSFNTTTINCLIDAFGEDSTGWIGKQVKVLAILSNVQGKMIKVYYFVHPDTVLTEQGNFVLKPALHANLSTLPDEPPLPIDNEILVSELPF